MFLDTSIIVEILRANTKSNRFQQIFDLIKDELLFISMAQIGELSDWCLKNKIDPEERIADILEMVNTVQTDTEIGIEGARIKHSMRGKGLKRFSLMDGIILASARSVDQKLLTADTDFRKAEDAILI
jgi:predicted nucleic acid-binding protein